MTPFQHRPFGLLTEDATGDEKIVRAWASSHARLSTLEDSIEHVDRLVVVKCILHSVDPVLVVGHPDSVEVDQDRLRDVKFGP